MMCLATANGYAQGKPPVKKGSLAPKNKDSVLTDVFKGTIPANGNEVITELILWHKPYADMGNFLLFETNKKGGKSTVETRGDWTVLKGSATDDNATVVEIDAPGVVQYFLRYKNGNLQKLDTTLHEMKPPLKYILMKQGK